MQCKIIDDFLTPTYHRQMLKQLLSAECPWYYHQNITQNSKIVDDTLYDFGFASSITRDGVKWSNVFFIPFVYQIQDQLPPTAIGRVRLDMTLCNPNQIVHHPHVDIPEPHYASIYYVNDSDGDTIIYNETTPHNGFTEQLRVQPKANRLLIFDGKYYHTGSSPSHHKNRIIINTNLYKK